MSDISTVAVNLDYREHLPEVLSCGVMILMGHDMEVRSSIDLLSGELKTYEF